MKHTDGTLINILKYVALIPLKLTNTMEYGNVQYEFESIHPRNLFLFKYFWSIEIIQLLIMEGNWLAYTTWPLWKHCWNLKLNIKHAKIILLFDESLMLTKEKFPFSYWINCKWIYLKFPATLFPNTIQTIALITTSMQKKKLKDQENFSRKKQLLR